MKKYSYKGNSRPFAAVLCHGRDIGLIEPVLECIEKTGLRLYVTDGSGRSENIMRKACSVIAVMTESFYSDDALQDAYIKAGAMEKEIISVCADETEIPELLSNFRYSRTMMKLAGYTPEEAAEKILSSDMLKKPAVTPAQSKAYKRAAAMFIAAGAAAAVLLVTAILSMGSREGPVTEDRASGLMQYGILPEDVENVKSVVIVGDEVKIGTSESASIWDDLIETRDNGRRVWIRKADGKEAETGGPDDLSFLTLLPNLDTLVLVNQTDAELPDLSSLKHLRMIELWDCGLKDVEGLRNCAALEFVHLSLDKLTDLSPLSDCPGLLKADITGCNSLRSLDGFAPPKLTELQLHSDVPVDIKAIGGLTGLRKLELKVRGRIDFSPLASCAGLENVMIDNYEGGNVDFSALGSCGRIKELDICTDSGIDISFVSAFKELVSLTARFGNLSGTEALESCSKLRSLTLDARDGTQNIDLSSLSGLSLMSSVYLNNISCGLDFLRGFTSTGVNVLNLFGGEYDWSGLSDIGRIEMFCVDLNNADCGELLDSIRNVEIGRLELTSAGNIDIAALPEKVAVLRLNNCGMTSLEGFPCRNVNELYLEKCGNLSSLKGIESLERLKKIHLLKCVRVTDFSALEGREWEKLDISGTVCLPDLSRLAFDKSGELRFENISGMTDMSLMDALPDELVSSGRLHVTVLSQDFINLNALLRFKGSVLVVSPALTDQADDLVRRGCFNHYQIEYPDSGWNIEEMNVTLQSLDELETLPRVLLGSITELCIAGDEVYDSSWNFEIRGPVYSTPVYIVRYSDGEEKEVVPSKEVFDMSRLSELTGLRRLRMAGLKIDSLEGIQDLQDLRELEIVGCSLQDYSPIYALDSLEHLVLSGGIGSLQGIQNLRNLRYLGLMTADVSDISPLKELEFSDSVREEGFGLCLPFRWLVKAYPEDLSALSAIPKFSRLQLNGYSNTDWLNSVSGKYIREAVLLSIFNGNDDLQRFCDSVSWLEDLIMSYNENVTDLRCLLRMDGLKRVEVSQNMTEAIHSLDSESYDFELIINSD